MAPQPPVDQSPWARPPVWSVPVPTLARHHSGGDRHRYDKRCGLLAIRHALPPRCWHRLSSHLARLEHDDRRLVSASRGVAVEIVVYLAPPLPQLLTFRFPGGPADHFSPDPAGQIDHRLRVSLQVQPPGRLGPAPAVHGHRDQVGLVFEIADDHAPRLAAAPARRGEPQCAPLPRARAPQAHAPPGGPEHPPVHVPGRPDEPPRWQARFASGHAHSYR
jgi:hypothetical protein